MNYRKLVKLSNVVGVTSAVLLLYWVFIFITMEVFGLKIFRENMTQTFYLSVLGILALMSGALVLNLMLNLSRIAERHNADEVESSPTKGHRGKLAFLASLAIIAALLFAGDYATSRKKETMLRASAASLVRANEAAIGRLLDYRFERAYIEDAAGTMDFLSKLDKNYGSVSLIVQDRIEGVGVYLAFRDRYYKIDGPKLPPKADFIFQTDLGQRDYLDQVFQGKTARPSFDSHDGNYELFYPVIGGGRTVILHFQDSQRYGKLGS